MAADLAKLRILVIADSVRLRKLIVSILNANNMKTLFETGSGQEGFSMLGEHSPDLVIADWNTGAMGGLELVRKIRSDSPAVRKTPIILTVDNNTDIDRINEARNAGVTGLLLKPFSAHHLLRQVGYAVSDTREFVDFATYVGPERRRTPPAPYEGPFRRETDNKEPN
jgi:CheY-like chemotaxis protein